MAKQLKTNPISAAELEAYLSSSSSFAFELECLRLLKSLDWECEHGGSYVDPVTGKPRQFDIRATYSSGDDLVVRLAIECKAIAAHYPLLVLCVPRLESESFHSIALAIDTDLIPKGNRYGLSLPIPYAKVFRASGNLSIYPAGKPVGKSMAQVGVDSSGQATGDDRDIYEKWSQALSSGCELVERSCPPDLTDGDYVFSFIHPMVVVPDNTLWAVHFDANGAKTAPPSQVDAVDYFVDHNHDGGDTMSPANKSKSHIQFVTLAGLARIATEMKTDRRIDEIFPDEIVKDIAEKFLT
jgi:hypothetical protein